MLNHHHFRSGFWHAIEYEKTLAKARKLRPENLFGRQRLFILILVVGLEVEAGLVFYNNELLKSQLKKFS